ncbi:unnamed protein product [Cochlearia groenlandica]
MAKNLFSLYKLAVGSSLSFRSLQTGTSGDHCQPSPPSSVAGYHVSPGGYMRGDVYREPNKPLPSEQFHIPRPKSNEILVKTKACGVCHSDFHVMKREIPFASPCVIGHEITVVEHGPLTDHKIIARFPIGSRVIGAFIMPCRTCSYCSIGFIIILVSFKSLADSFARNQYHNATKKLVLTTFPSLTIPFNDIALSDSTAGSMWKSSRSAYDRQGFLLATISSSRTTNLRAKCFHQYWSFPLDWPLIIIIGIRGK